MIKLSIIIVNYNGSEYLYKCVTSIIKNEITNKEILIVDNNSKDRSIEKLNKEFKQAIVKGIIRIFKLKKNYGPAYARNIGAKLAKGNYLAFLDNDTEVDINWTKTPLDEFSKNKKTGIVQSKMILLDKYKNKIDYIGEYIGTNGFLVQKAKSGEIDRGQYDKRTEILAAKSAGMFIRKELFDKIGGFDKDYFMYLEETDLGWRSRLLGYDNIFIPDSIIYHRFGTSTIILGEKRMNFIAKFHGTKNYILTLTKNLEFKNLLKIVPQHIILWIGLATYKLIKGQPRESYWIIRGILWNIVNLPKTLNKRKIIQKKRMISDKEIFRICMKKEPFSYYFRKATVKHKFGNAESF